MTASQTATVEVLAAEVRVLMVGSRQVTLSLARQLDRVPLDLLEVFGRINLLAGTAAVIGRHLDSGALCVASVDTYPSSTPWIGQEDLGAKRITVCERVRWTRHGLANVRLEWRGRMIDVDRDCVDWCGLEHAASESCASWYPGAATGEIDAALAEHDAWRARHIAAAKAPLIVLAGLR